MIKEKIKKENSAKEKGFVILLSVLISSLVLFVGVSVYRVLSSQLVVTRINKNSQEAFYAADAGVECTLYHDFEEEEFSTTFDANITCNGKNYVVEKQDLGGDDYRWEFYMNFLPDPYCTEVVVEKTISSDFFSTKIESTGYNKGYNSSEGDCSGVVSGKVQRAIKVEY